jgi:MGT family glycosyltransferase
MTTVLLGSSEFRRLRPREWLHMLRPMLPSLVPIVRDRSHLLRRFGASVPRPAFPATGGLNLALWPRDFQAPDPRVDASFKFVGPMLDPETRPELAFELSDQRPVVYMSLGTLHRASMRFYRQCLDAFSDLPLQLVLSTGNQADAQALDGVAANAVVRGSVAQLAVLRRASVFITHGGMNSTLESLACGVPMLVIPQQLEQLVLGLKAADRGAARVRREHLAGQELDALALRRDVEHMLKTPSYQSAATAAQERLGATGGFRAAADEVQKYCPQPA